MYPFIYSPILKLPDELICEILSCVPKEDRLWCCLVCHKFFYLLFSLNSGVFDFNISDANYVKNLQSLFECGEIAGMITHLMVSHPADSTETCLKKSTTETTKGIFY